MEFQKDRAASIKRYAQRQVNTRQFAGVAWCMEHRGAVVERGSTGFRDADAREPLGDDTLYRLYSMTKPVVSIHCLQLVEQGLLQLDDPVSRWIPTFNRQQVLGPNGRLQLRQRDITIEDLLTHRSGLSYDFLPDCAVAEEYRAAGLTADGSRSLKELSLCLAEFPLAFQPGERWYYSLGIDVLARIIELVSGKALGECLHDALFEPLGMHETGFMVSHRNVHRLADMFGQRDLSEVQVVPAPTQNILQRMNVEASYPAADAAFARGGHGLYSTIDDYRRFMALLMNGKSPSGQSLLSTPMLDLAWQNRLRASQMPIVIGQNVSHGYGWGLTGRVMADTTSALRLSVNGEGGWAGAATTWFWIDRTNQFSGIVMSQYLGSAVPLGPDIQALAYAAMC